MAGMMGEFEHDTMDLQSSSTAGPNLFRIAWQRKALLLLGVVLGFVLGALYYAQRPPVYQSAAQVLVVKKRPDVLPIPGEDSRSAYYEDYLSTHLVLLRSRDLIRKAVKEHKLTELPSLAGAGDPTGIIIGSLGASRDSRDPSSGTYTNIINLSYRASNPEDCGKILEAVIQAYRSYMDDTYKTVSKEVLDKIIQLRDGVGKDLKEKEEEYRKFRLDSPLVRRGKEGANLHEDHLASIDSSISTLEIQKANKAAELETIETAVKEGRSKNELIAIVSNLQNRVRAGSDSSKNIDDAILNLKIEERQLLEDYGADHPRVRDLRARMQMIKEHHAKRPFDGSADPQQAQEEAAGMPVDPVDSYIRALRYDLENIRIAEAKLREHYKLEKKQAREMIREQIEDERLNKETLRLERLYDGILSQLKAIDMTRDFGGYDAKILSEPGPGWQIEPRAFPIFSVAIFLGLVVGAGLAYLAEISDKSFRTPEEIRRRLGLPIVGHIPFLKGGEDAKLARRNTALDPTLCTFHRPKSTEAEAYRGVRTALYFSTRGEGHKVIQITSPNQGDGKSTLTANLAISIAQSGKRVVLLDADFRKPRQHKVFGVNPHHGLASVICGEAELKEAIYDTGVPNLSLMPCGPIPPNPAELLTSPQFKQLLDQVRQDFDIVLVDTPPVLAVTDPSVVAPRVDGLILVVRVSKNGRPHAERAKEILSTLGAKVLGIVVNGVGRQSGFAAYSYGSYRSGYGYGTYSYGYGEGNESYYQQQDTEGSSAPTPRRAPDPTNGIHTERGAAAQQSREEVMPDEPAPDQERRTTRWW